MREGRLWVRGLVAAVATVAIGVGAVPGAAHASGGPTIVVTPSTRLVSGQTVQVKGSGFPATTDVAGVECPNGAIDPSTCDLANFVVLTSDAQGNFKTPFVMHRTLNTFGGFQDCAPSACEVLFALASDFSSQATASVKFDASVPLPPTTATVTPATNLADGQELKVKATGFTGDPLVTVTECVVAPFACGSSVDIFTQPDGSLSTKFAARRMLVDGSGTRIDCATTAGSCEILVVDFANLDYRATAPLEFDPSLPPPPPPTLKVNPTANLPYYARVTLFGKHWEPGDFVLLLECQTKASFACAVVDFVQPDSNGVIQAQPMLQRELVDELNPGAPPIDCAAPHAGCALIAESGTDGSVVTVPVKFDPNAPIPPAPSAKVRPAGPYHDQQVVTVTGKNFAPRAAFSVSECATSAGSQGCLLEGGGSFTSATGAASTQFQLFSALDPLDPTTDCTNAGVTCFLEVSSEGGAVADVPLTFAGAAKAASVNARSHGRFVRVATPGRSSWTAPSGSSCPAVPAIARAMRATGLRPFSVERACAVLRTVAREASVSRFGSRR